MKICSSFMLIVSCLFILADSEVALAEAETKDACSVSFGKVMSDETNVEAEKVIDVLKAITKTLADHDFKKMAGYMDANCSTYDESTHKLVVGSDAIVKDVEKNVKAEELRLKTPPINFTVDRPFVAVNGDRAVVSFVLIKEVAGPQPAKYESHCSDVFVKRQGEWKKLHFCGDAWKKIQ